MFSCCPRCAGHIMQVRSTARSFTIRTIHAASPAAIIRTSLCKNAKPSRSSAPIQRQPPVCVPKPDRSVKRPTPFAKHTTSGFFHSWQPSAKCMRRARWTPPSERVSGSVISKGSLTPKSHFRFPEPQLPSSTARKSWSWPSGKFLLSAKDSGASARSRVRCGWL